MVYYDLLSIRMWHKKIGVLFSTFYPPQANFRFLYLLKTSQSSGFLKFLGCIEMEHWT